MNQADYIEFHPHDDERQRIITEDIFDEFMQELYKVVEGCCVISTDIHYSGEIESIKVNRYPDNKLLIAYFPLNNSLKIFQGWSGSTYESTKHLIYKYLVNEKNTKLSEVDPKNLKKVVYEPNLSISTYLNQSVFDQAAEEVVERENQMLKEAVEAQKAKQGSEFNRFIAEFEQMKPEEQNSAIYSFTDLLKRMHEIQSKEIEESENQWLKYKDEQEKETHDD